ncbi:YbhB/YbcL family Raf kinase inhibitor-like protein [Haloferax sp. S1W]|uniref:YbhB/YbcL family Raf kinase inhibitor-like protein n=1 Tax=Haloferax sp. S1W TaxID=3377110 RepID=UPI0037CB03E7
MVSDSHTRRAVVTAVAAALAGCAGGDDGGAPASTPESDNPALGDATQMGDLRLTSSAFEDGGAIPRTYGHDTDNVNPPLSIANSPPETQSLTLIMDDPDAVEPAGKVWLHWLVWNIPPTQTTIPEGWTPSDAIEGTNDFGNRGYGGPAPPDERHTYRFKLYALDTTLDLPRTADKRAVGEAMRGRLLGRTQLTGTYAP